MLCIFYLFYIYLYLEILNVSAIMYFRASLSFFQVNVVKKRSYSFNSKWFTKLLGRELRIVMVGLKGAGQTAILSQLRLGEIITTIPRIGFNVKTVEYKQISFTVWDVDSQHKNSFIVRHYFQNTQALIFVVDSNDRGNIDKARNYLIRMLNEDELRDAVILVLANKQDLPNAMSAAEVAVKLGLHYLLRDRSWYIQATSTTGDGLFEGMDWLVNEVSRRS